MTLADEYAQQLAWRDWGTALSALPPLDGVRVLDLGCGVGDLSAELSARGARVLGIDMNGELLAVARSRNIANAEFRQVDLRDLASLGLEVDGIWCSFLAAYFSDLSSKLQEWGGSLASGGWIALTEIDDLFGHEPVSVRTSSLLASYAEDGQVAGRYDFHMGGKLSEHLTRAGFEVREHLTLSDREFSFDGPAEPAVLEGWRRRFERMQLLRSSLGPEWETVRDDFLGCLEREDHRSRARVHCCIGVKGGV